MNEEQVLEIEDSTLGRLNVVAANTVTATVADQCKKGGWRNFTDFWQHGGQPQL